MTSPAERLLKAAEILEKRASEATGGPWQVDGPWWWDRDVDGPTCSTMVTAGLAREAVTISPQDTTDANARYIATMNPEVGKAVAAWLRDEGSFAQRGLGYQRRAEEVADLVLAGEQEGRPSDQPE